MVVENNPAIIAYRKIESVLSSNITDINSYRSGLTAGDPKKQWFYPYVPSSLDELYPRVTIQLKSISKELQNAGDYFTTTYDGSGNATSITYGQYFKMGFDIIVFIKRDQKHSVTLLGEGSAKSIKNNLQALYLINQIQKQIKKNYSSFTTSSFDNVSISNIETPYEDGKFFFATKVSLSLTYPNLWGDDLTSSDIINSYTDTITATQKLG